MATLIKQFTYIADTTINPSQVNANFDDIVAFLNNNTVHTDGTRAMTGHLALPGSDPTSANQAARKSYVDAKAAAVDAHPEAAAAQTTANSAQTAANAAQTSANTAFNRWIGGFMSGTTNGAGDVFVVHNQGKAPRSIQISRVNDSADCDWDGVIQFYNNNTFTIRVHNTNHGGSMPSIGVSFSWTVQFDS